MVIDVGALIEHPFVLAMVPVTLTIAVLVARGLRARRDREAARDRTIASIERDMALVAPHFRPPEPGQPNTWVPGRLEALEDNARQMRSDFLEHMDAEMRKHVEHHRERTEDRREFRSAAERLHERIDQLFEFLKGAA